MTDRAERHIADCGSDLDAPSWTEQDDDGVERQVGERLSEQAREMALFIRERWNPENTTPPLGIADLLDALARQLAEAEQKEKNLRDALRHIKNAASGNQSAYMRRVARAALNSPDPPASPAEGFAGVPGCCPDCGGAIHTGPCRFKRAAPATEKDGDA